MSETTAPLSGLVPRTDAGARALIDHVDRIADKVNGRINATDADIAALSKSVNRRFRQKVSYFGLITLLCTTGGAVVAFSVNAANTTRREMAEARQQLADDVRQVRKEQAEKLHNVDRKVDAIFGHLIEGKSRASVREEVQRIEREK